MRSFVPGFLVRHPRSQYLLQTVRAIGEYKGRQEFYRLQSPQALETLRQQAVIQSTESSNRIEGVVAPLARIQALVGEKTSSQNRPE